MPREIVSSVSHACSDSCSPDIGPRSGRPDFDFDFHCMKSVALFGSRLTLQPPHLGVFKLFIMGQPMSARLGGRTSTCEQGVSDFIHATRSTFTIPRAFFSKVAQACADFTFELALRPTTTSPASTRPTSPIITMLRRALLLQATTRNFVCSRPISTTRALRDGQTTMSAMLSALPAAASVPTIDHLMTVERAAQLMAEQHLNALPVIKNDKVRHPILTA